MHKIDAFELNGEISVAQRARVLRDFMASDRDGVRVLIVSNVGSVGLNIDRANILIFYVRLRFTDRKHADLRCG